MTQDSTLWQTKVAARLHDPAEKALVLLRDPAGHENGTSRALTRLLGFQDIGTETVDARTRLEIYATAYRLRLIEALDGDSVLETSPSANKRVEMTGSGQG